MLLLKLLLLLHRPPPQRAHRGGAAAGGACFGPRPLIMVMARLHRLLHLLLLLFGVEAAYV